MTIRRRALAAATAAMLAGLAPAAVAPAPQRPGRPAAAGERAQFLQMFARGYFPGRSGQLLVVPRQGTILTRNVATAAFMHGSPWPYDTRIPMFFTGSQVRPGVYNVLARQQDVVPTIAAVIGAVMPPTVTGRALPILVPNAPRPRAVVVVVLDGTRPDYFDRDARELPTLSRLRKAGAWMTNARIDYLPSNTAVGHSTIATGADPRVHGITGNNLFDRTARARKDSFAGWDPRDLMALTLADVWQLQRHGRPIVIALGASVPASTALAGHGGCQINGAPTTLAGYLETSGRWGTNRACYAALDPLAHLTARSYVPPRGVWLGHRVNTPSELRRSAAFPRFEADALIRLIEASAFGKDDVTDLVLVNYKAADYVGHQYGPGSPELAATLREMDANLARVIAAIEARVGRDYLLAVTADHGMPNAPKTARERQFAPDIVDRLHAKFDPAEERLVPYYEPENAQIFVDLERLAALKLTLQPLAAFLAAEPYMYAVFTEDEVRAAAAALTLAPQAARPEPVNPKP
jgi:hypothetical protein